MIAAIAAGLNKVHGKKPVAAGRGKGTWAVVPRWQEDWQQCLSPGLGPAISTTSTMAAAAVATTIAQAPVTWPR